MPSDSFTPRGNAVAVLHEVRHALERLAAGGAPTTFDLRALPLMADDLATMDRFLGIGEVTATITAGGRSTIRETRFPGVWLVDHFEGEDDTRPAARMIEVDFIPALLRTPAEDAGEAVLSLAESLDALRSGHRDVEEEPRFRPGP